MGLFILYGAPKEMEHGTRGPSPSTSIRHKEPPTSSTCRIIRTATSGWAGVGCPLNLRSYKKVTRRRRSYSEGSGRRSGGKRRS